MLPLLDVPTMMVMTAAASFAMALALLIAPHERREGLGLWALAMLLNGLAFLLFALDGQGPRWVSNVLANTLLAGNFALALAAIEQFRGRARPWWRMALPVLAMALLCLRHVDDFTARVVIVGVVVPLQAAMMLHALWRPGPRLQQPTRGMWLLSAGLALQFIMFGLRGWRAGAGQFSASHLLQSGGLQSISLVLAFVVVLLSALGFILMAKARADAALHHLAMHDGLTGLANRRAVVQALERGLAQAARSGDGYALLLLDIDQFKLINDSHGHLTGDLVLRELAARLRGCVRAQDMAGRYGGEEFMVLLPGTSAEGARTVAEALRRTVQEQPFAGERGAIAATVSVGLGAIEAGGGDAPDATALIASADRALYAAKAGGRNRVEHDPG